MSAIATLNYKPETDLKEINDLGAEIAALTERKFALQNNFIQKYSRYERGQDVIYEGQLYRIISIKFGERSGVYYWCAPFTKKGEVSSQFHRARNIGQDSIVLAPQV